MLGTAGAVVFVLSCLLVPHGLRDSSLYSDVHVYSTYAAKMADGQVPYHDFFDEYPPLAQPVFLLARVAGAAHYALAFKALMALFGLGALACAVVTLRALRASTARSVAAVAVIAASPLLVGPIFLNAYDLWPAFLLSAALMLLVLDRPLLAFAVLGAAGAAKVYPVAVLPIGLLYLEQRLRRSALLSFAGVVVLAHLPFALLGPGGLRESYWLQAKRGLELNSLGGAFLLAFGDPKLGNEPPGSLNVLGGAADAIAVVSSLLVVGAIVAACVAFNKVFSAQYVDWLVPLAPLAGIGASAATLVVLALTRSVFSHHGGIEAGTDAVWLLLVRDSCVVVLTVLLLVTVTGHRNVKSS